MAYYYKIGNDEAATVPAMEGIQVFDGNSANDSGPCIKYDFSKHVLIELLDNITPEAKLWTELGLAHAKNITHKRMIVDPHRVNCRRAVVVCSSSDEACKLAQRLSQVKIMRRSICAVVIQTLLSDICLFEKQIIQYGDKRSQHQLVYVTELTRRREASGLAQYLREKFSPFGTILSVLVSEDKDGYAYPEGVVKFAHLSEAFAAELAYDQCAVALERLSVTTHHNILLSQCDLRARLREAYSRQPSEFSFNVVSPESHIKNNLSKETDLNQTKILPSSNYESSIKESESVLNESGSTVNGNNEFPSDSAELADVLKKPCESNLVDCLQSIVACSESTVSRRASSNVSCAETEPASTTKCGLPLSSNCSCSPPLNQTWSSRIVGWISELPNIGSSSQVNATINDTVAKNDVNISDPTALTDNKGFECNQQSKQTNAADIVSNTGSFVTCNNGDLNLSLPSSPGEVSDSNNVTMVEGRALSHSSECQPSDLSDEETSIANNSSVREGVSSKSKKNAVVSLKRKNSSMMTQKLSLKSKKMYNPEIQDSETTVHLPSVPQTKRCSVLLNDVPELNEIAKSLSLDKLRVFVSETLSASQPNDESLKIGQTSMLDIESKAKSKKVLKTGIGSSASSVKSQPVRRSNRLTTRDSDKRSSSLSTPSEENGTKPLASTANFVDQKERMSKESESPLWMWLRKELDVSTNSQMTTNKESTKSIVCATTNKDVLISVGCSHMTCDICYPDSTKLLLGFH